MSDEHGFTRSADLSHLCEECAGAFEHGNWDTAVIILCEKCQDLFPSVVRKRDLEKVEPQESDRVEKTPSTFKHDTKIEEEDSAAATAKKIEKSALDLQEELRDKCDQVRVPAERLNEHGIVTRKINPYGRRKYDRGPESEEK